MICIQKYPLLGDLAVIPTVRVTMPRSATPLSVQQQIDTIVLWAVGDDASPLTERVFRIVGTGHEFPDVDKHLYIGTVQTRDHNVCHIFEALNV